MTSGFCNHNTPKFIKVLLDITKVLSHIIHFAFKLKGCSKTGFSVTSIYWTSKGPGKTFFTKKSYSGNYILNQKLLFYYQKYDVQTRYRNTYGYCSFLGKFVLLFF